MGVQGIDDLADRGIGRFVPGIDRNVGFCIAWISLFYQALQRCPRIVVFQKWPVVSPRNPLHQDVEIGFQPYRYTVAMNVFPCFRVHERAAAGGQYLPGAF